MLEMTSSVCGEEDDNDDDDDDGREREREIERFVFRQLGPGRGIRLSPLSKDDMSLCLRGCYIYEEIFGRLSISCTVHY